MLKFAKINCEAQPPIQYHIGDAGFDLCSVEDTNLPPSRPVTIKTGLILRIPEWHVGLIRDRSSLGCKGITTLAGVIDPNYRGEVKVCLINLTNESYTVLKGNRIAQLLVVPIRKNAFWEVSTEEITNDSSPRGDKGFGSTGV